MSRRIPSRFIPDGPVFFAEPCPGCGDPVPSPVDESADPAIYPSLEIGETMLYHLGLPRRAWHFRCAFEASDRVESVAPLTCPRCGAGATLRPEDETGDKRVCVECVAAFSNPAGGGL